MALIEEFDKSGNWLFKHRSYLPLILFALATIVLLFDHKGIFDFSNPVWGLSCFLISMLGLGVRIFTIGFIPKATSGKNRKGQIADVLNKKGIYSVVRHPLYLGNFLVSLGIFFYVGIIWYTIVCILLFWLYYERIMFAEELFLRNKFKEEFLIWSAKTPSFIPRLKLWQKPEMDFSIRNVLKRENDSFFSIMVSFVYFNALKNYIYNSKITLDFIWQIIFIAALITFIVLKILKKKTKLLDVVGR